MCANIGIVVAFAFNANELASTVIQSLTWAIAGGDSFYERGVVSEKVEKAKGSKEYETGHGNHLVRSKKAD